MWVNDCTSDLISYCNCNTNIPLKHGVQIGSHRNVLSTRQRSDAPIQFNLTAPIVVGQPWSPRPRRTHTKHRQPSASSCRRKRTNSTRRERTGTRPARPPRAINSIRPTCTDDLVGAPTHQHAVAQIAALASLARPRGDVQLSSSAKVAAANDAAALPETLFRKRSRCWRAGDVSAVGAHACVVFLCRRVYVHVGVVCTGMHLRMQRR